MEAQLSTVFVAKRYLEAAILDAHVLFSRLVYYSNGTSTFNLTKVKLSGDVESNLSPETAGVRGVSGSLNVANSSQHGASLPPSIHLNKLAFSTLY